MQLGFVSDVFPEHSLEQVLTEAERLGFDSLEVACRPNGHPSEPNHLPSVIDVSGLDDSAAKKINDLEWHQEVKISCLCFDGHLLASDGDQARAEVDHLGNVLRACGKLGVPRLVTSWGVNEPMPIDQSFDNCMQVWRSLTQLAEEENVSICVDMSPSWGKAKFSSTENETSRLSAFWREVFDQISSEHLGLICNPMKILRQEADFQQLLREFPERISHLKIEIPSEPGQLGTFSDQLQGMNLEKFFSVLDETGYRGPVRIEPIGAAQLDLETRRQALREAGQFLRPYLPGIGA